MKVALVHDYLTQRGGAERVVLSLLKAFPDAPLHTSLYEADSTFPEFREADVRSLRLNALRPLRRNHRLALPLLGPAFSHCVVDADVALCSSSGWAHGAAVTGQKIVYCHTPARWLYQTEAYVAGRRSLGVPLKALQPALTRWDLRAARTASVYVANSSAVRQRIASLYGFNAEVIPPPHGVDAEGAQTAMPEVEPGFFLCVGRLLPYKNVGPIVDAFDRLPGERLVVVGTGPNETALRARAGSNVRLVGAVSDGELRWLYANSDGLVAASYEDFGLTPLEAAAFGKPVAALRWGGFLDTVVEGDSGVFFDWPDPASIADAVGRLRSITWSAERLRAHADEFREERFVERIRAIVENVASGGEAHG